MTEKFAALKAANRREPGAAHAADFVWMDNPTCPHCGREVSVNEHELWQLYDDQGDHRIECPHCDEEFNVTVHTVYRFSTDEQEEDDDAPNA